MGRRAGVVILGLVLVLVAGGCSGDTDTSPPTSNASTTTTTTPVPVPTTGTSTSTTPTALTTTTPAVSTTTIAPSSTTVPPADDAGFVPAEPWVTPEPTPAGGGSGCAPGPGPLPDGVWFGFLDDLTVDAALFDLACYRSCKAGTGHRVTNTNRAQREVRIGPNTLAMFVAGDEVFIEPVEAVTTWEDISLHTDVWLYVTDGIATHIVFPDEIRGCRANAVTVEWIARLPPAVTVAFIDQGLLATTRNGVHRLHDMATWAVISYLGGDLGAGPWGSLPSAGGSTVAIGRDVHWWTGDGWDHTVLPEGRGALAAAGDRVLTVVDSPDRPQVEVFRRTSAGWASDGPIDLGDSWAAGSWETWAGAIDGDRFAVADTGLHTNRGIGRVQVFEWSGVAWEATAELVQFSDTGMFGSWLDLEGDRLVVGADGATPGPGSPGGVYLFVETDGTWDAEIVGEGGEGFGYGASISGDTIVTAASHSDADALWVFTIADPGWVGTPIPIPDTESEGSWAHGLDIYSDLVAMSLRDSVYVGRIEPTP